MRSPTLAVRANLASAMDRVCDDHEALIITRNGEQSVVMLSLEDYKALEETGLSLAHPRQCHTSACCRGTAERRKGVQRKLAK
jgi:antitoxin YefM